MMKKSRTVLALLLAVCVVIGYGFESEAAYAAGNKKEVKAKSVSLNHKVYTIKKGKTVKLKATILPKNVSKKNKKLTWSTNKKKIASVKNGKVKGLKNGKAVITAKVKGKKATCTIYVGTPVKKAVYKNKTATVMAGQSITEKATLSPAKPTVKKIIYSSSDNSIATVDANGKITGVSAGKVTITAKPKDEAGKAAILTVTVLPVVVPVASVTIDPATKEIRKGESFNIKASVLPVNASNKKVRFKSNDEKVVTVDANGKVTAVGRGDATITVTSEDGAKTAGCKVKVMSAEEESATSQADLNVMLADPNVKKIIVKGSMNIGSEDNPVEREDIDLIIDAPNAHIENYGKFRSIQIDSIGSNSFIEHMVGNVITYAAKQGKLLIAEAANATLKLVGGAERLTLVNDGNVDISISTKVDINISGNTRNAIPVYVGAAAQSTNISTLKELKITTEAKIGLNIIGGGENTEVNLTGTNSEAEAENIMPDVSGLGCICVNLADKFFKNILAENSANTQTQTVNIEGKVEGIDASALSGAKISVIPFEKEMTTEEVLAAVGKASYTATTNASGVYNVANVKIGNYYLLAQKDGFVASCSKLILTSNDSEKHIVGAITLKANADASKKGTLSGMISDALTGDFADQGLTLRLRKGGDNTSGDILETTYTVEEGNYRFTKQYEFGQYTVEIVDNRDDADKHYTATYFNAIINKEGVNTVNSKASPTVESDQVRFVLAWGDEASGASADLDSHLTGPTADKKAIFHTWFSEMSYRDKDLLSETEDNITYADLDVDDTTWEGPETTTIYRPTEGVYSFYVHDYSNRENNASNQMSISKAQVEVYKGERKIAGPFNISSTTAGILWHVCDYDSVTGRVKEVNKVLADWAGEPEEVGLSAEDIMKAAKDRLPDTIAEAKVILSKLDDCDFKTDGQQMIAAAESALNSNDVQTVRDARRDLQAWINSITGALFINDVWTGSGEDETNLVYRYMEDEVYDTTDDEEEKYLYSTLTIYGTEDAIPKDELRFSFGNDGVTYSLDDTSASDPSEFEWKLTATFAGQSKVWYVKQEVSEDYLLGVSGASHTRKIVYEEGDEDIEELIDYVDTYVEWEEEPPIHVAYVYGTEDEFSFDTTFTLTNPNATWKLEPYNENGYVANLTVTAGGKTRVYYVEYDTPNYIKFGYELLDEQGRTVNTDCLSDSYEGEELLYEARGFTNAVPNYTVRPLYPKSTATITDSGIDGSDKKVVVTCGDQTRTTYLKYVKEDLDIDVLYLSDIEDWEWYSIKDDVLTIDVTADSMPDIAGLSYIPSIGDATVDFEPMIDSEYDGTLTLRLGDYSRTYLVNHKVWDEL